MGGPLDREVLRDDALLGCLLEPVSGYMGGVGDEPSCWNHSFTR